METLSRITPRAPSKSAVLTAAARALGRDEPPPVVLDDSLAAALAGPEAEAQLRDLLAGDELRAFVLWNCIRTRYTEDAVERALEERVRQYVILGAGLDSFAYRRDDLLGRGLRVFEVDHPASQAWKRARLARLGVVPPLNLVFAAVDFESESLVDGLARAGFDWQARTIFSWIGVTMYLTIDAIRATLGAVHSSFPGSAIVMTYNQHPLTLDDFSRKVISTMANAIGGMGEPFVSYFTPAEAEALARGQNFVGIEHFSADDARRRYLDGRADVRLTDAQRMLFAKVPYR